MYKADQVLVFLFQAFTKAAFAFSLVPAMPEPSP
jgi:hypothetical protein